MKIHVLQHADYEGPGDIAVWAHDRGHTVAITHLYRGDALPFWDSFDLLVVMGGEMNIYQYRDWPWLKPEREMIEASLAVGKRVVGICLGAQLIADALGSRVTQNPEYELGWLPITFTPEAQGLFGHLPEQATVLHWHGDTFELPEAATRLAFTPGCPEQGYVIPEKCLGLQFHMEADPSLASQMVQSQESWPAGQFVQTRLEILVQAAIHHQNNRYLLHGMLDAFVAS
jgi:GMP synthase-like glutamine amidotransferase